MVSTITPESLDICSLPWFPMGQYHGLPHCPAIYFVIDAENTVVYIGRTVALKQRWAKHHRLQEFAARPGLKLAWLFVTDTTLLPALEAACIAFFQPCDNRPVGRPRTGERLQPFTVMLPPELHEWGMNHSEGLSPLVRRLLREEQAKTRK